MFSRSFAGSFAVAEGDGDWLSECGGRVFPDSLRFHRFVTKNMC